MMSQCQGTAEPVRDTHDEELSSRPRFRETKVTVNMKVHADTIGKRGSVELRQLTTPRDMGAYMPVASRRQLAKHCITVSAYRG